MDIKISFQHMDVSENIDKHAREKLQKITEYLRDSDNMEPLYAELFLKANKQHPHHRADLVLRTKRFSLDAHDEGTDMYVAIDNAIDKIIKQLVREKEKLTDKQQKREETEKNLFRSDKYKL